MDDSDKAWVIEIETEDSVSDREAKEQWKKYDQAYIGDDNLQCRRIRNRTHLILSPKMGL